MSSFISDSRPRYRSELLLGLVYFLCCTRGEDFGYLFCFGGLNEVWYRDERKETAGQKGLLALFLYSVGIDIDVCDTKWSYLSKLSVFLSQARFWLGIFFLIYKISRWHPQQ